MPTYFFLDPFEFPYYFYRIWGELILVLSIVVCIPSTFCPTLGHHQGRICYKSDVTFVLANYYCVRTSLLLLFFIVTKCTTIINPMKTLIHKNILPTDPNKKIKLIIIYNKFKTSNLVIRNNSSPSIGVLQKTNVIYKFKCPLGDCISDDNNNIYVGLTSTTLSRRLTMHLSDTSSIAQHLKKHSCPTTQLRKILTDNTTILEHQNNKQKLQILEALYIRNQHLIELIFKPVLTYLNVFSYWHYLQNYI